MTPDERAAAEAALNTLISNAFQIGIAIFAVLYFGHKAWVKWGAPVLKLLPERRSYYVVQPQPLQPKQTGTPYRITPDTYQSEPVSTGTARTGSVPDDEALIRHLAGLQKGTAWALSANKIAEAVGGTRESVLAIVREVRGRETIPGERMLSVNNGERQITWES